VRRRERDELLEEPPRRYGRGHGRLDMLSVQYFTLFKFLA
jgi:hypothetical protein